MTLVYQAGVLIVPWLLRLLRATKRPLTGLGTVFGDGCAMVALLNTLVMLDTAHEGYCHRPPQTGGTLWQPTLDRAVPLTRLQTSICAICSALAGAVIITE
jgi:hypothetical protein